MIKPFTFSDFAHLETIAYFCFLCYPPQRSLVVFELRGASEPLIFVEAIGVTRRSVLGETGSTSQVQRRLSHKNNFRTNFIFEIMYKKEDYHFLFCFEKDGY